VQKTERKNHFEEAKPVKIIFILEQPEIPPGRDATGRQAPE
jgi:hypothetical protein